MGQRLVVVDLRGRKGDASKLIERALSSTRNAEVIELFFNPKELGVNADGVAAIAESLGYRVISIEHIGLEEARVKVAPPIL